MATAIRYGRTLRATLCEVERGVFYMTYPECEPGFAADELAAYHIGRSAADAKHRIEQNAFDLGYDSVVWTETVIVPLFAANVKIAPHPPAATYVPREWAVNLAHGL